MTCKRCEQEGRGLVDLHTSLAGVPACPVCRKGAALAYVAPIAHLLHARAAQLDRLAAALAAKRAR